MKEDKVKTIKQTPNMIVKHTENQGLDGNRNPPEDVDTIRLAYPVSIYPHETKTK